MPVTVCRRAKTQPVATVKKLWKVGVVITQDSGCSRSTNDGTRDTGASLLNALVFQPRIVREASLVLEPSFHLLKKCESRTKSRFQNPRPVLSREARVRAGTADQSALLREHRPARRVLH